MASSELQLIDSAEELAQMIATEDQAGTPPSKRTPQWMFDELCKRFDPACHKEKEGFTYIPHEIVRYRINRVTSGIYDWVPYAPAVVHDAKMIEKGGKFVQVFTGLLTIPGLGTRLGVGTSMIQKGSDKQFRSADSIAFVRAGMAFGVGLYLYGNDLEQAIEADNAILEAKTAKATEAAEKRRAAAAAKPPAAIVELGAPKTITDKAANLGLTEIKAEIGRISKVIPPAWMADQMTTRFGVSKSSDLAEPQWRELYIVGAVEEANFLKDQAAA